MSLGEETFVTPTNSCRTNVIFIRHIRKTMKKFATILVNHCGDMKLTKERFYFYAKLAIWLAAILSMTCLSLKDIFELIWQYKVHVPVTNVEIKDVSGDGIRLPNGSVCIQFEFQTNVTDHDIQKYATDKNFTGSIDDLVLALLLAEKLQRSDNNPFLSMSNWKDYQKNYANLNQLCNSIDDADIRTFRNQLAYRMCKHLDVRISYGDSEKETDFDICGEALRASIPFNVNKGLSICFRIPFYLFSLKHPKAEQFSPASNEVRSNGYKEKIRFQFSPMKMRQLFPMPFPDFTLNTALFFPEDPLSYVSDNFWKLAENIDNTFSHTLSYYSSLNYLLHTQTKVGVSITGKYTKLIDADDCINIYNRTNCMVDLMEDRFRDMCQCTRYPLRHFLSDPFTMPYCNLDSYTKCYKKNKDIIRNIDFYTFSKRDAQNECGKCSKMNMQFEFQSKQVYTPKGVCEAYSEILKNSKMECQKFLESLKMSLLDINKSDYLNGTDKQLISNFGYHPIFGRAEYEFFAKSFSYPEFLETPKITVEEFKSNVGGILGLYLGVSGITGFAMLIALLKVLKRRWRHKDDIRRHTTVFSERLWQALVLNRMNSRRTGSGSSDTVIDRPSIISL